MIPAADLLEIFAREPSGWQTQMVDYSVSVIQTPGAVSMLTLGGSPHPAVVVAKTFNIQPNQSEVNQDLAEYVLGAASGALPVTTIHSLCVR